MKVLLECMPPVCYVISILSKPLFMLDADPDPTFNFHADPDPVHVIKICADWSTDPPRLHFSPPRLHFESPRLHWDRPF
jgi:hypothetical protein